MNDELKRCQRCGVMTKDQKTLRVSLLPITQVSSLPYVTFVFDGKTFHEFKVCDGCIFDMLRSVRDWFESVPSAWQDASIPEPEPPKQITNDREALQTALRLILQYRLDISDKGLAKDGFCQGEFYQTEGNKLRAYWDRSENERKQAK